MTMFDPEQRASLRQPPVDASTPWAQAGSQTLLSFLNQVYAWMAAGLALTAVVAWYVSTRPDWIAQLYQSGLIWVLFIAQLVLVFVISAAVRRINATMATVMFLAYSALNGVTLSIIFLAYAKSTITSAFVASASMFGAMSLYGMFTKRDLSLIGRILFMALIGLVVAMLINLFFSHGTYSPVISYLGVLIFCGLTAYDTQKLKQMAYATSGDAALAARLSIVGALVLYLDFINLFLFLLRIMGNRRN